MNSSIEKQGTPTAKRSTYLEGLEVVDEVGVPLEGGQVADLEVDQVEGQEGGQGEGQVAGVVVKAHVVQAVQVA